MKSIKVLTLFLISGMLFQSCSKDEDLIDTFQQADNEADGDNNSDGTTMALLEHNIVQEWTDLLLEVERYATGMRPNASARALAYIYLASYETAVPGMDDYVSNSSHLNGFRMRDEGRGNTIHWELALNACFAQTLDHFLINVPSPVNARIAQLENAWAEELSANLPEQLIEESQAWGTYVARQVIEYSQTDAQAEDQILEPQPTSYEPPTGDGFWTYSADPERALFPYWGKVRTFVISPNQTTTLSPIAYSENENSAYFAQMKEAYEENNEAREEDGEQLWIAEFWSDDVENITFSPPARQFSISNQLIDKYSLNLEETLQMYLKLGFSMNDAAVSTWKYKYDHMVMRPNVYIHEFIDPDFQTNLFRLVYWPNPSFPGYPSGHSCFASAASGIFIDQFGDQTNFTDVSHQGREEFRGAPRSFNSFSAMAEENAFSRIPLGVHIRMDCTEGLRLGYEISDAVIRLQLNRQPGPA